MEERLNLYFYPLQRLKIYEEPNKVEVALSPLKQTARGKEEGIASFNCRPVENPHMIYDSLNSNILHEIKNFYASDKVYHVVGSNYLSKPEEKNGSEVDEKGDDNGDEVEDDEEEDEEENEEGDECYYTDGDANPEEYGEDPFGDETKSKKRDKSSNRNAGPRCSGRGSKSQDVSERKRAMRSCLDFLRSSRNYEKEIRRDHTRVRASLDVVNTLATFYIDKSMHLDSRYAYDLSCNVKCPVLVMPSGFYNNEIKLMETQIGECIYDEGSGRSEKGLPADYLPVNLKFCFDNEVTIVPTNLSTGNYDTNERGLLPTYYRYTQKVKLAKEYNRKRSYGKEYKVENDHLLYKLERNFTELNQKESITLSKYLRIKEIKTDTNNINESVVYARNDVGLVIFQVQYCPGDGFHWDGALWRGSGDEDSSRDECTSHSWQGNKCSTTTRRSLRNTKEEEAFQILNYKIKIAKDILLFDRLMQICPSTWTYGRCTMLGNYNSLYSYDLETNLMQIVELKQTGGYFKKYDTALCLCYLQDENTLLLGCRSLYIYDTREKFLSRFSTRNRGAKRVSTRTVRQKARDHFLTGIPLEMKTNPENVFHEDRNRSHFNRSYTAVAKNPHFSFIVASVNASFNVIEIWDLRNQYEPIFLFPLNISEFKESYFRYIEWICITPTGQNMYEQKTSYNLITFSYYENMVYVRRILIRDDFTSYKDLGMEAYTNHSFSFAYNYTFKGVSPGGAADAYDAHHSGNTHDSGNTRTGYSSTDAADCPPLPNSRNHAAQQEACRTEVDSAKDDLRANNMQMRQDVSFNHIFSYKSVKIHVEESLLVDTAKFTPMQKNKTESIRLISDHAKYNSINTKMYNLFFGVYGMTFVQLCVPVLYCARQPEGGGSSLTRRVPPSLSSADSRNRCDGTPSPGEYLEERFYLDGKNTRTWNYFVKKKNLQQKAYRVKRQEIVGVKFDYVQFIFHTNSAGQLFCTPINLCMKNLPQEKTKEWIPVNKSYVASTYRNEGLPAMLSRFADLVQNTRRGEVTQQRGAVTEPLPDSSPTPHNYKQEEGDDFNFLHVNDFEGIISNEVDPVERDTHTCEGEEGRNNEWLDGGHKSKFSTPARLHISTAQATQPIDFLHLNKDNCDMLKHTQSQFCNVTYEFFIHLFKLVCRDKILMVQNNTNVIKVASLKKGCPLSRMLVLKIKGCLQRELSSPPNSPPPLRVEENSDQVCHKRGKAKSVSEGRHSSYCDSFRVPLSTPDVVATQDGPSTRFASLSPAPAKLSKEEIPNGAKKMTNQDASAQQVGEGNLPERARWKSFTHDVANNIEQSVIQRSASGKTSKRLQTKSDLIIERMQEWTRGGRKAQRGKNTTHGTTTQKRRKRRKKKKKATSSQCRNSETLCSKHNLYELFAKYNVRAEFKNDVMQTNLLPNCSYVNVNYLNKTFFRERKHALCTFHFNKFFYVQTMADLKWSAYGLTDQMRNQFVRDSCPYVTFSPNFQPSRILKGAPSGQNGAEESGGGVHDRVHEFSNHNEKLFYEQSAFNFPAFLLNLLGEKESAATDQRGSITQGRGELNEKCQGNKGSDRVEEQKGPHIEVNQNDAQFGQITNFLSPNEGYTFDALEEIKSQVEEGGNDYQQSEPQSSRSNVNPFGNFVQTGGAEEIGDSYKPPQEDIQHMRVTEWGEDAKRGEVKQKYPLSVLTNAHKMKELLCLYNQGGVQHILDTMKRAKLGKKKKKKKKKKNEKRLKKLCEDISKELNKCVSVKNFLFYDAPICFCLYGNDPNNKRQYNTYINSYTFLFDVVRFFGNNVAVGHEIERLYLHGRVPLMCEEDSVEMAAHSLSEEGDHNGKNVGTGPCAPQVDETANEDPFWEDDPFVRLRRARRINRLDSRDGLPNYDHLLNRFKRNGLLFMSKDITYQTFQHMLQNEYYIPVPKYMKNDIKMKDENFQCTPVSCFKNHVIAFYNKKLSDVYNSIDFRDLKNFNMHQYVYHEYFNLSGIQTGTPGSATLNKYIDHGEGKHSTSAALGGFKGGYKIDCALLNKLYKLWPSESHTCESRQDYLEMMKTLENRKKAIFHK
ncbi:hypothetical protein AK88_01176 [Plasmodium fragile]|uniref:Uncharacterized protein n=1 Tax=Plasmodium fragile TaxID=5857 RepID=A0A0D9QPT1_PLAFR|nr:uncharacterized protein AK88_01176 [Plasmodium fragile]KJP89090.1 hypothetical protein AK88_01176 [Plasmodium fragile]